MRPWQKADPRHTVALTVNGSSLPLQQRVRSRLAPPHLLLIVVFLNTEKISFVWEQEVGEQEKRGGSGGAFSAKRLPI
jgi:hypothetical protein